jgi:predicted RNase H-like HicB family nuclease
MTPAPAQIIFQVTEDAVDGGYNAEALGYPIFTQGESVEELREMVKDAVRCHFEIAART